MGWVKLERASVAWLLVGLVLLWIYVYRIHANPLTWEEPRRSLVALEMIYGADYVVPRVLGEPYLNKPPLQNWLVVLLAGNDPGAIGPVPIRLLSLLALAGTAACLWSLGPRRRNGWIAVPVFLTMGIVVQYGRSGELDVLFAFWIVAALAAFEAGRRTGSPGLEWGLSQALLAGGILTKGIAPLFFYPPVLFLAWRGRRKNPLSLRWILAGLGAEALLVLAWLVPYTRRASATSLAGGWADEILMRTPLAGAPGDLLSHLLVFPFETIGAALPWSLLAGLLLMARARRETLSAIGADPALRLAGAVVLWSVALFWLMPGSLSRYLMPAFAMSTLFVEPLIANASTARPIRRSLPVWLTLLGAWTGGMALTASLVDIDVGATFVAGLLALVAVGGLARARPELLGFSLLLAAALLYGAYYAGITRTLRAEREVPLVEAAEQIAASIEGPSPVVCGAATSFRDCFIISRRLRRPLQRRPPETGAYFLVDGIQTRPRATALVEASPLALWRVGD